MNSVKEVVTDGNVYETDSLPMQAQAAKTKEVEHENVLKERMKLAEKLLQEVIELEQKRDIDMTSVIGWLESKVFENSPEIAYSKKLQTAVDMEVG